MTPFEAAGYKPKDEFILIKNFIDSRPDEKVMALFANSVFVLYDDDNTDKPKFLDITSDNTWYIPLDCIAKK